jgi:hypothetical protein
MKKISPRRALRPASQIRCPLVETDCRRQDQPPRTGFSYGKSRKAGVSRTGVPPGHTEQGTRITGHSKRSVRITGCRSPKHIYEAEAGWTCRLRTGAGGATATRPASASGRLWPRISAPMTATCSNRGSGRCSCTVSAIGAWASPRSSARRRRLLYWILFKLVEWMAGISLWYPVELGRRVRIWHHSGIILSARIIGDDVQLRQNTTMGIRRIDRLGELPIIEPGSISARARSSWAPSWWGRALGSAPMRW